MAWTESLSAMFTSASKENRRPAAYCAGRTLAFKGSTEQQGQTEVRYSTWGVGVGGLKVDMVKIQFTCMKLSVCMCYVCSYVVLSRFPPQLCLHHLKRLFKGPQPRQPSVCMKMEACFPPILHGRSSGQHK